VLSCAGREGGVFSFASPMPAPSPMAGRFVYVAASDGLFAYGLDSTGALTPVGEWALSPTAVTADPLGRFLYVTSSAALCAFHIRPSTGLLDPLGCATTPPPSPGALSMDPLGRFAYRVDTSTDTLSVYAIDADTGALTRAPGSPYATGSFPLACVADPTGRFVYVASRDSKAVWAYAIDGAGILTPHPGLGLGLAAAETADPPGHIAMHPTGRYLYVSTASPTHGRLAVFAIDPAEGALVPVPTSPVDLSFLPGSIDFDASGRFAYIQELRGDCSPTCPETAGYSELTIDEATGLPTPSSRVTFNTPGGDANDFARDPAGRFAYMTDFKAGSVAAFAISPTTGALSPVRGSPFATGTGPLVVTVAP
jgi:6-phosphogluconolactonase